MILRYFCKPLILNIEVADLKQKIDLSGLSDAEKSVIYKDLMDYQEIEDKMLQLHEEIRSRYDAANSILDEKEREAYLEELRLEREKNFDAEQNMRDYLYHKKEELKKNIEAKTRGNEL